VLTAEQADDVKHKTFCTAEFEKSADEDKATSTEIGATTSSLEQMVDEVGLLGEDIKTLQAGIAGLDKSVADATEQRKEEHAAYTETLALTETAIELIGKAKNRLQKFYNPTLYKAAPKTERSMEQKIIDAGSFFAQISARKYDVAPPPAPETFSGGVQKNEKSGGVLALMDMMTKELGDDMKDSEYNEKTAQKEYVDLMADSQASRAQNAKSITEKDASKATLEGKVVEAKESKALSVDSLENIHSYVQDLHVSCDFIMENFGMRAEARTNEVESLKTAKSVLSGANFGF